MVSQKVELIVKLILIIFITLSFLSCNRTKENTSNKKITTTSKEDAEKFVLVDSRGNNRNWVLRAEKANNFGDSIKLYVLSVDFYDAEGKYNSTLTADSGVVFSPSGDMKAINNVEVTSRDSTKLKTDNLRWNNKRKKIITDDEVEITKKNSVITGKGMESDANLEHIEIKRDFNAVSKDVKENEESQNSK